MKQYLLSVHHASQDGPEGIGLTPEEMELAYKEVDAFNQEIMASGAFVFAGGLNPPSSATTVRVNDDKTDTFTTDGPFAETKEQLGGFWVIKAPDLDAALELARKGALACRLDVEVRPFQDGPPE
jgi:hypothetical protein